MGRHGRGSIRRLTALTGLALVRVAPPAEAGLQGAEDTVAAEFVLPDQPPETITARFVLEPR